VIAVALSVLGLLAGGAGLTLAIAANNRADRIIEESSELIRSQFAGTVASGAVDPRAIRDVALVRYDALKEMAGQLSFSVALLNAAGDGIVLTSINGRSETRTYAKTISGGKGAQPLSPEEEESVRSARMGQPPMVPAQGAAAPESVRFVPRAAARDTTVPNST
jgi:Protein of unknown function (DUF4446)